MTKTNSSKNTTDKRNQYINFLKFSVKVLLGALALLNLLNAYLLKKLEGIVGFIAATYNELVSSVFIILEPILIYPIRFVFSTMNIEFSVYPEWRDLVVLTALYTSCHIFHITAIDASANRRYRGYIIRITGAFFGVFVSLAVSGLLASYGVESPLNTVISGLICISVYRIFFSYQFALDVSEDSLVEFETAFTGKLLGIGWLVAFGVALTFIWYWLIRVTTDSVAGFSLVMILLVGLILFHIVPSLVGIYSRNEQDDNFSFSSLRKKGNFFIGELIFLTLASSVIFLIFG